MAYDYSILSEAEDDLDEAIHWYLNQSDVELGRRFFEAYEEARECICEMPTSFSKLSQDDNYRWIR
ncbi:MAG: hypothetical protein AAGI23_13735 [Bacteroidota bacterium]